jgi:hypothetical protein
VKKLILLTITVALLIIGVMGFKSITANNNKPVKQEVTKQPEQKEIKQEPVNKIDKIIIPIRMDTVNEIKPYQKFGIALITEMAKENNIQVETKEIPTFNDVNYSLENGDITVNYGVINVASPELIMTQSYITTALYNKGKEIFPEKSYSFAVNKDNRELYNFFNDMIKKYNENGKLKQLQEKYLGNL